MFYPVEKLLLKMQCALKTILTHNHYFDNINNHSFDVIHVLKKGRHTPTHVQLSLSFSQLNYDLKYFMNVELKFKKHIYLYSYLSSKSLTCM